MGSATQSFAFYIICSLALPPAAELLAFLWLYNTCNVRSEKNIRKKEREINPKPPRRRRLRCPLPLLPAAPSRRQTSSQFLLSPPPVIAAPAAARRINVAPPFPRPCSLVLSSRHCRCRRCRSTTKSEGNAPAAVHRTFSRYVYHGNGYIGNHPSIAGLPHYIRYGIPSARLKVEGADVLRVHQAPQSDREAFLEWWTCEKERAVRDRVILVVVI